MSRYIVFAILLAVLVAGCTNQTTKDFNSGVVINSFEADSQVRSGDVVLFDLEVQNIGGTTAKNVQVDLLGVEGTWRDIFGNIVQDTQTKTIGTLMPPLVERNIPGGMKMVQWQLQTPQTPQGLTIPYRVEARVTYDYNTSGSFIIGAISEDELERQRINGKQPTFTAHTMSSEGPIHLEIPANYMSPVIVDTSSSEQFDIQPFRFEFVNTGGGFPITPEDNEIFRGRAGGRLRGTIEVRGPGVQFYECLGQTSGNVVNLDDAEILVRLRDNNRVPIGCTISIDKRVWGNRPEDTIQFVFNIFYRYYNYETVTVNVIGER